MGNCPQTSFETLFPSVRIKRLRKSAELAAAQAQGKELEIVACSKEIEVLKYSLNEFAMARRDELFRRDASTCLELQTRLRKLQMRQKQMQQLTTQYHTWCRMRDGATAMADASHSSAELVHMMTTLKELGGMSDEESARTTHALESASTDLDTAVRISDEQMSVLDATVDNGEADVSLFLQQFFSQQRTDASMATTRSEGPAKMEDAEAGLELNSLRTPAARPASRDTLHTRDPRLLMGP